MADRPLSDPVTDRSWLRRYWRFLLVCLLLLCAELFMALRWGTRGDEFIYWLFILDESHPSLFFNLACLIALAAAVLILRARGVKRYVRIALIVLFLLPLPIALFGRPFRLGWAQHAASIGFCGHVYQLTITEFSGFSYAVYECDRVGLVCHQNNDYASGYSISSDEARLRISPDPNTLVLGSGEGRIIYTCTAAGPVSTGSALPIDAAPGDEQTAVAVDLTAHRMVR